MKRDGRTLDHATLETIRLMAVERVLEGWICAGTEPRRACMELCEAHWRGQNAAAQGRTVKGQDRGAVGQHQERAPTRPVILPSTNCRLYYRLVSKTDRLNDAEPAMLMGGACATAHGWSPH